MEKENGKNFGKMAGQSMQLEVPADQYAAAVEATERRIAKGEVPNVTDPSQAEELVRKGHFTYR